MAADRALAEDHQTPRHDVRALDRDRDGCGLPAAADPVAGAEDHALAAVHVHRILRDVARTFGRVIFRDRRGHRGFLAAVNRGRSFLGQCGDRIGVAADSRECFLDAFETADRDPKLLADARVSTSRGDRAARAASGIRRQRDRTADRQAFDQHTPALASQIRSAYQLRERHEYVLATHRSVLERDIHRKMAAADFETFRITRQQREGDAEVGVVAEQLVRIVHAEREANQSRDRRQRNVALVEGQAHAEHVGAVPLALADDTVVRNRGGVRAGIRTRQREAGNLAAIGEARKIIILLFLCPVMDEEFAGAKRIGHRDRGDQRRRHAGYFLQHRRMRERRETETAVLLRNDQAEEFVLFEKCPHLRRQVGQLVADLPVIDHPAELFNRAIEERLLLNRQFGLGQFKQLRPVRLATEQFALEANRSRFERDLLGV